MLKEKGMVGTWVAVVVALILLGLAFIVTDRTEEENSFTTEVATTTTPTTMTGYQDELALATGTPVLYDAQGNPLTITYTNELASTTNTTYYACGGAKEFKAKVEVTPRGKLGKAEVFLKDGSKMLLTQTPSASGVRYANRGESFVFWTKGDTAFIQEGNVTSYADCQAKPSN